jgi:hypothetical protein
MSECHYCHRPDRLCVCPYSEKCQCCGEPVCSCGLAQFRDDLPDSIETSTDDEDDIEYTTEDRLRREYGIGICCYCGEDCGLESQACGACVRNGVMFTAYLDIMTNN